MLYERWQKITRDRRHEVALRDLASGQMLDLCATGACGGNSRAGQAGDGLLRKATRRSSSLPSCVPGVATPWFVPSNRMSSRLPFRRRPRPVVI